MLAAWIVLEGEFDWTPAIIMPSDGYPEVWYWLKGRWVPVGDEKIESWSWLHKPPSSSDFG